MNFDKNICFFVHFITFFLIVHQISDSDSKIFRNYFERNLDIEERRDMNLTEFDSQDVPYCEKLLTEVQKKFETSIRTVKWIANLSINFNRTYDGDQSNRQHDEEVDPSETIEKVKSLLMEDFKVYQRQNLLATFCMRVWETCTDIQNTAETSSSGFITTETLTLFENGMTEMPMLECTVNQNPPEQFFTFTLTDENLNELVFIFKKDNNMELYAYTPEPPLLDETESEDSELVTLITNTLSL